MATTIDRFLREELVLPFDLEDVKVPLNQKASNTVFNSIINKINDNYQYILNNSQIVDNNIPFDYNRVYYFNTNEGWFVPTDPYLNSNQIAYNKFVIKERETDVKDYLIIFATDTSIDFFVNDNLLTVANPQLSSINISYSSIKTNLFYQNISDIEIGEESLYVADSSLGLIVKYNISDIIFDDNFSLSDRVSKIVDNQTLFVDEFSPKKIYFKDKKIYCYDDFNNKIFIYTDDLFLETSFVIEDKEGVEVTDISVNADLIYVLYSDGQLNRYSGSELIDSVIIAEVQNNQNEIFKKIVFSNIDDNVFYLLTDKNIHKKFISKLGSYIGIFAFNIENDQDYNDINIINDATFDLLFVLDQKRLHFIKEKGVINLLYDENNINDTFDVSDILIQDDELSQDYVYNASLQKLIFNHLLLAQSIFYKIILDYDSNGNPIYGGLDNITEDEKSNFDIITNSYYFGINEVLSSIVFNRVIENLHSLQKKLLIVIAEREPLDFEPVTLKL